VDLTKPARGSASGCRRRRSRSRTAGAIR
jgi:hypothetical protein